MNFDELIAPVLERLGLRAEDVAILTLHFESRSVVILDRAYRKYRAPLPDAPDAARPRRTRAIREPK